MIIGYCSPFNPLESGISDFSEELVFALAKHMTVVIFSPCKISNQEIAREFEVHSLSELDNDVLREKLDIIVYHIGNNYNYHNEIFEMMKKYPGVMELHDFGLHNFVARIYYVEKGKTEYLAEAKYCHGKRGFKIAEDFVNGCCEPPWETYSMDMPMNRRFIETATAVIVHSETAKQNVLGISEEKPVINISLHTPDIISDINENTEKCRDKLSFPRNKLIFGSFGFGTRAKRLIPILDALKKYKEKNNDFLYLIVGDAEKELELEKEISARDLKENVRITGYISIEDLKNYIGSCDFCLNLRYPTHGESSASLHRMMGFGKPIVVTDIGAFAEYPDDIVLKIRYDNNETEDIYNAICCLAENSKELKKRGLKALNFAKENCDINRNAERYYNFFRQIVEHSHRPDYEDVVIGRLCELGLTDKDYLKHVWETLKIFEI